LPNSYKDRVLQLADEKMGHLGFKKTLAMVKRHFTWPLISKDVARHCRSCDSYQRYNKSAGKKAPMIPRQACRKPFEKVAFDLVSPLPIAKGGY